MPAKMPTVEFLSPGGDVPAADFEPPSKVIARRYAKIVANPPPAAKPAEAPKAAEPPKTDAPGSATDAPAEGTEGNPLTVPDAVPPSPAGQPQADPEDKGQPKPGENEGQQANPGEPPKEERPKAEPDKGQDKNLAKAWSAVMRKEREVQKALAEVREYQKDQAGYNEYRQNKTAFENFQRAQGLLTSDPDEALRLLGAKGGYNEISERMLDKISKGEVKPPQERLIETLVAKIDNLEKQLTDTTTKRAQEEAKLSVDQYIGQLDHFIRQKPEDFALTIANNAAGLVFDTMRAYHEAHGKFLSEQEASEMVENHFRGQARSLLSNPAIRKALDVPPPPPPKKDPTAEPPEQKNGSKANAEPPKTLTNQQSPSGVPIIEKTHMLTREEQIRRLVARKYGQAV